MRNIIFAYLAALVLGLFIISSADAYEHISYYGKVKNLQSEEALNALVKEFVQLNPEFKDREADFMWVSVKPGQGSVQVAEKMKMSIKKFIAINLAMRRYVYPDNVALVYTWQKFVVFIDDKSVKKEKAAKIHASGVKQSKMISDALYANQSKKVESSKVDAHRVNRIEKAEHVKASKSIKEVARDSKLNKEEKDNNSAQKIGPVPERDTADIVSFALKNDPAYPKAAPGKRSLKKVALLAFFLGIVVVLIVCLRIRHVKRKKRRANRVSIYDTRKDLFYNPPKKDEIVKKVEPGLEEASVLDGTEAVSVEYEITPREIEAVRADDAVEDGMLDNSDEELFLVAFCKATRHYEVIHGSSHFTSLQEGPEGLGEVLSFLLKTYKHEVSSRISYEIPLELRDQYCSVDEVFQGRDI